MSHESKDVKRDLICKTVECKDWGTLKESLEANNENLVVSGFEWTGEKLHKVWSRSCSKLPVAIERDWSTLHRHKKERWNELAKVINTNMIWI